MNRGFMTIAFGERYRRLAYNLLFSYKKSGGGIPFVVITDVNDKWTQAFDRVIIEVPQRQGFMSKLNLYDYTDFDETIFIDADCLCAKNIDSYFDIFQKNGSEFSVFGTNVLPEITLQDPDEYYFSYKKTKHLGVEYIPSFNGGIYYIRKGQTSAAVFDFARKTADAKQDYDFIFYGDEPYLALSMAIHKCRCVSMNELLWYPRSEILDIDLKNQKLIYKIKATQEIINDAGVVHFGNSNTKKYIYKFEVKNMQHKENLLYHIFYKTGILRKAYKFKDDIIRETIKFLVLIKHKVFD